MIDNKDVKVKGFDNLIKRNKSCVINNDTTEYEAAKARRLKSIALDKSMIIVDSLVDKTNELENKIDNIQDTLTSILKLLSEQK